MASSPPPAGANVSVGTLTAPAGAADADTAPRTVRDELATPYTFARWQQDLHELAEGADTGFNALAALGMRWYPGRVYAIGARPGHGKTGFMLEAIVRYLEQHRNRSAAFLSWEEPLADIVARLLLRTDAKHTIGTSGFSSAQYAPIPLADVYAWGRNPKSVTEETGKRLMAAGVEVERLLERLRLVDGDEIGSDARTVFADVAAWSRELRDRHVAGDAKSLPLGLVAVDYFQKLRGEDARSRQVELQRVSDVVRRFAKGYDLTGESSDDERNERRDATLAVPVLIGAQITRGGEESSDRIREADDLLNDAAVLIRLTKETDAGGIADFEYTWGKEDTAALRLSVPKHRGGGTKPDTYAKIRWLPARHSIAEKAVTEPDGDGRVKWYRLDESGEAPSNGNGSSARGTSRKGGGTPARDLLED